MRNLAFLLLIFCFISCKDKQLQITEFDEIIHYKLDTLAVDETDTSDILSGEAIQNISDTLIIDQFTESGFVKSEVNESDYIKLHQVLTSNQNTKDNSKCLPIYRDFLILKKKNKTVGIFKICFECSQLNYLDSFSNEKRLMTDENSFELINILGNLKNLALFILKAY